MNPSHLEQRAAHSCGVGQVGFDRVGDFRQPPLRAALAPTALPARADPASAWRALSGGIGSHRAAGFARMLLMVTFALAVFAQELWAEGTVTVELVSPPTSVTVGQLVNITVRVKFTGSTKTGPWQIENISLRDDDIWPAFNTIAQVSNPKQITSLNTWVDYTFTNVRLSDWDDGGDGVELYAIAEVDDKVLNGFSPDGKSAISKVAVAVQYTVTASAGANGSVTPTSRSVTRGSTTTFTVSPNVGYERDGVSGDSGGSWSGNTYTTSAITGAKSLTFTFKPASYTVNASAGAGGSVTPSSRTVTHGSTTTFTVSPSVGYERDGVTGDSGGSWSGNTYTTSAITGAKSLTFTFKPTPQITALSFRNAAGNTITTAEEGTLVTLRVDAVGMNGQTVSVELWEDDGALGDDRIDSPFSITIGSNGVGTTTWSARYIPGHDSPISSFYLRSGSVYSGVEAGKGHFAVTQQSDPYGIRALEPAGVGLFDAIPVANRNGLADLAAFKTNGLREGTRTLGVGDKKLMVVIHGWNRTDSADARLTGITNAVHSQLGAPNTGSGWVVIPYDWTRDASTGGLIFGITAEQERILAMKAAGDQGTPDDKRGDEQLATTNGTQAAERAYQHGLLIGAKILEQVRAQNLKAVHLVGHSAGSWAVYGALRYLHANASSETQLQATFLDPYIPGQVSVGGNAAFSLQKLVGASQYCRVSAGATKAEQYWAADLTVGTDENFGWSLPEAISFRTDGSGAPLNWRDHRGPVIFYQDTVPAPNMTLAAGNGWKRSLAYNDYRTIRTSVSAITFASTLVGSSSSATVRVTNEGRSTLPSLTVTSSGPITVQPASVANLAPNASADFTVTFTPTAAGAQTGALQFSGDFHGSPLTLSGSGTGLARIQTLAVSQAGDFGQAEIGGGFTVRSLTIGNSGNDNLRVTAISLPGNGVFRGNPAPSLPTDIAPGGTLAVSIAFQPTSAITYNGDIVVTSNRTSGPDRIAVTGRGVNAPPPSEATIAVLANPTAGGTVTGGGTFAVGSTRTLTASANTGYTFAQWSDGVTTNPRQIVVPSGGATYTANFAAVPPPDTQGPAVTLGGAVVAANGKSATVSGTATDSGRGGNGVASVTVAGVPASGVPVSGNATANWTATVPLTAGEHTVSIEARDSLSNPTTISGSVTVPAVVTLAVATRTSPASGESYPIQVTANTTWTAASNQTWATVTPASGSGDGTVTVTVAANTSAPSRTATITIGGQSHALTQSAPATKSISLALANGGNFGNVTVGASASTTLTLSNPGTSALSVAGIVYPAGYSGNWSAGVINAGASQAVTVTFAPTASQTYTGNLVVNSDATEGANSLALTGTGVPAGGAPTATHALFGTGYSAGGTVTITNTITYTGTATSLGWQVLLPAGWSYVSGGGSEGDVKPAAGTTDLLEWAWTNVPASPATFTYTLQVPAQSNGDQSLTALGIVRTGGSPFEIMATPDPLRVPHLAHHCADTDRNFRLSLLELTRVIELYNTRNGSSRTGAYRVESGTEDGFAPEPARPVAQTATLARYHCADTNRDGRLSLLELTRVIELYNYRNGSTRTGQYRVQSGTEDGFAPGP